MRSFRNPEGKSRFDTRLARARRPVMAILAALALLAVPHLAQAQGIIGGAEEGVRRGNRAAGPVGGVVGGAVGAGVGGVVGGVKGVLGVPDRRYHRRRYHHHHH